MCLQFEKQKPLTMKKRIAILALALISCLTGFGQRNLVRSSDVQAFLNSKTYVVLENNPTSQYNIEIRDAVERSWTITPYEFITAKQFDEMRKDIDKSFLVLIQMRFDRDKVAPIYNFLSISMGAAVKKITDMPDICSVPLGYKEVPEDSYTYKLEGLIRFMQGYINDIKADPSLIKKNAFKIYNNNVSQVKGKELWVTETDLEKSVRSLNNLRKYYKHTVKVVKPEDIQLAIQHKKPNVLFTHKVGPEGTRLQWRIWKMIFSAEDGKMYYYNMHTISKSKGDGFLSKDLKKLNK